jgi:hypothetical protein
MIADCQSVCSKELTTTKAKVGRYCKLPVQEGLKKVQNNTQSVKAGLQHTVSPKYCSLFTKQVPQYFMTSVVKTFASDNINLRV